MDKKIYVACPSLPPLKKVMKLLERVWDSHILSNMGEFELALAEALRRKLHAEHIALTTNGTAALSLCLRAMDLKGEIITTPYTFVATAGAILWNNCTPVFCDIDPATLNLDPDKAEALITPRTSAILAVHVYGTPCDNERLSSIARKHHLKLIYDAAHAFDVQKDGTYIVNWGDASALSFHATKKYHTFEGGAVTVSDLVFAEKICRLRNFGFHGPEHIMEAGINAKMDEFRAIIGLLQLENMDHENQCRDEIAAYYRKHLSGIPGIGLMPELPGVAGNNGYFPIFIEPEYRTGRDELIAGLAEKNIITRKYFYPLVSNFEAFRHLPSALPELLPIANSAAGKVLCLPMHSFLTEKDRKNIIGIIRAFSGEASNTETGRDHS